MIACSKPPSRRFAQRGISLVELLVALVIALILTAGVISIFVGSNQAYRFTESSSRVQENARFAIDTLSHEIRKAGYAGCRRMPPINNVLQGGGAVQFQPALGVSGLEAAGTQPGDEIDLDFNSAPVSINSGAWLASVDLVSTSFNAVPGSDILYLWNIGDGAVTVEAITPGANANVRTSRNHDFQDNDILLMTDCTGADLFQACNVTPTMAGGAAVTDLVLSSSGGNASCQPGNISGHKDLRTSPGAGEVVRLVGWVFYIGKRGDNANNPPALFRRQVRADGAVGQAEELVEGVENMQVLYGVSTGPQRRVNAYRTANAVTNWESVMSVRVELLMTGVTDNVVDAAQPVFFNGTPQNLDDRRLRKVVTTTTALRNRTF